jgi:hypothetical protein
VDQHFIFRPPPSGTLSKQTVERYFAAPGKRPADSTVRVAAYLATANRWW